MTILCSDEARAFAAEWIGAWNAHDVERILGDYTDDVRFSSPFVVSIDGVYSGELMDLPTAFDFDPAPQVTEAST